MPEHENILAQPDNIFMTQQDRACAQLGDRLTERHGVGGLQGFTFPLVYCGESISK